LPSLLRLAKKGPVLLQSAGQEFLISKADDFDREVEALRASRRFQAFLDKRLRRTSWIPLAQVEQEIAAELGKRARRGKERGKEDRTHFEQ